METQYGTFHIGINQYDGISHGQDIGLEAEEYLSVLLRELDLRVIPLRHPEPSWPQVSAARSIYRELRLELGRDVIEAAWQAAREGDPEWASLRVYGEAYRASYRGSDAQKRHQAKYQSRAEVKARRAELARHRRAARRAS